ncbi:MAG: phosphotransferase, partial [Actinomycetota bacterium]
MVQSPSSSQPVGIDLANVSAFLEENLEGFVGPFTFNLIAGGRSNLTYEVIDSSGARLALRRPPVSHVLPTAHDMTREYRILKALAPVGVPVPTPL